MEEEIRGVRSGEVEKKIDLQLQRFIDFFEARFGRVRVSAVTRREVEAWLNYLFPDDPDQKAHFAPATVNNHKVHLLFMS